MKNITVSVDDAVYRRARLAAARMNTSVSALVTRYLRGLDHRAAEFQRLEQLERDARNLITDFSAADNLSRDELHRR